MFGRRGCQKKGKLLADGQWFNKNNLRTTQAFKTKLASQFCSLEQRNPHRSVDRDYQPHGGSDLFVLDTWALKPRQHRKSSKSISKQNQLGVCVWLVNLGFPYALFIHERKRDRREISRKRRKRLCQRDADHLAANARSQEGLQLCQHYVSVTLLVNKTCSIFVFLQNGSYAKLLLMLCLIFHSLLMWRSTLNNLCKIDCPLCYGTFIYAAENF